MKKHLFLTALVLALVMCFSLGVCAHEQGNVVAMGENDPNQYVFTDAMKAGVDTEDLWIGTLKQWKDAEKAVGTTGTVLENGEAIHNDDIIVTNGKVVIAIAAGTRNPWGYPGGSILDAGQLGGRDTVWAVEPLVNGWDSWAPNNCGVVTFDIVDYKFDGTTALKAVKVTKKYTINEEDITVVTYYGMAPDSQVAYTYYEYTNNKNVDSASMSHRFAVTNKGDDGGAMQGVSLLDDKTTYLGLGSYGAMVASYGQADASRGVDAFHTALVMPGKVTRVIDGKVQKDTIEYSRIGGSVGYKCIRVDSKGNYRNGGTDYGVLAAKETRTYNTALVISDEASPAAALDYIADVRDDATVKVSGTAPAGASIVVKVKDVKDAFGWFFAEEDGTFEFNLPKGKKYEAYVESADYSNGEEVSIDANADVTGIELDYGKAKETVYFALYDQHYNDIYGKVELFDSEGNSLYPTVRFNGNSVFQADEDGLIEAKVCAGKFTAVVYGQGYWFYSEPVKVKGNTKKSDYYVVSIDMEYGLKEGWLSGDLHHHADKNDAFAHVEDLVPSIAASDIDVMFVTDHDFTTNNYKAYQMAGDYGIEGFVPSEEISCSWAHFNVMPVSEEGYKWFLDENADNAEISNQFAELPVFVKQTHDNGAAITANHPWYSYGLFMADYNKAIPGGYTDDFDCVEINACNAEEETFDTINSLENLWTTYLEGGNVNVSGDPVETKKAHYVVGGSDTHDVLYPGFSGENYENVRGGAWYATGKIRTIAYVGEESDNLMDNGLAFNNAVLAGNSYTTFGPLLQMDSEMLPGETYDDATFEVSFKVESLTDIDAIYVLTEYAEDVYGPATYTEGMLYDKELSTFDINKNEFTYNFSMEVAPRDNTWVAFVVMDENGNFAITNPYWLYNPAFSDVAEDAYYAEAVEWAAEEGITEGIGNGEFGPDDACTRAQAVTFLYRAAGEPVVTEAEIAFTDVDKDAYYYNAVQWAVAEGITQGTSATTFSPNAVVTRGQMVTFMYRAAGEPTVADAKCSFTDVEEDAYYHDAVLWAVAEEITKGVTATEFAPNDNCLRAQIVTFLYRAK